MSDRTRPLRGSRVSRVLVLVLGLVYLTLAAVGFAETGTGEFGRDPDHVVLGFGVSTLLNVVHGAVGVIAVLVAATRGGAQVFAAVALVPFTALFVYGVVATLGADRAEPLNVTWADNVLYLLSVVVCLTVVLTGRWAVPRRTMERERS